MPETQERVPITREQFNRYQMADSLLSTAVWALKQIANGEGYLPAKSQAQVALKVINEEMEQYGGVE